MKRGLLLIAIILTQVGYAQTIVKIDSSSILIGNQATLSIQNAATYPTTEALSQGDIVALAQRFDTATATQYTTITCFEEGEHWIRISENDSILLTVNDVANVDTSKTEIKDIADVMDESYTFWEIFRWILLALGIIALILATIYIVSRIRAKKPIIPIPQAPPVPADIKALRALEELRTRQLWQQGLTKEYHTGVTDIVRSYLEEAWDIPSTDMTSDETLEGFESQMLKKALAVSSKDELSTMYEKLKRMLKLADMVKFAKSEPLSYEHDQSMADAVELVKRMSDIDKKIKNLLNDSKRNETKKNAVTKQ